MEKRHISQLISNSIRNKREEKGHAQEKFAMMAGIDRSYYGMIERGNYGLTVYKLLQIALALDEEPASLIPTLEELKQIAKDYPGLEEEL
tara:strand:+ start:974 stop:1243 length:270 start_codon:yes stop_codon:yes gene_type:complete